MNLQTSTDFDVLVVGYGPVGAAMATLLGRYGIKTLIVDKAPEIVTTPRAIALDNEALRVLQMTGMPEDAFPKVSIPFVRMLSPIVGEFARINTSASTDGHPRLVTFYQPELEAALRKQVERCSSVTVMVSAEVLDAVDVQSHVQVTLKRSDGSEQVVTARYLVGADGAGSIVRRLIGQEFNGKTYAEDWLIVDALRVPGDFDHVEFICDPKRPTPHMVAPGKRTRWEFMMHPHETRELMERDETIYDLLKKWGTPADMQIERKAVYRFHARSCDAYSKGKMFLVGDAAHITPPFVGQGLVAGLRDVANLAWKISAVVRNQADPAILDSYDIERRPHATRMIALAKRMGQLVMPRNALSAFLIHGMLALLRVVPGLRTFLEENDIKPKNEFQKGLFLKSRGRLKRGAQLAQGYVRKSDGSILLSDDAIGTQIALVGFGLDPVKNLSPEAQSRWKAAGGRIIHFCQNGQPLLRGDHSFEDLHNTLIPGRDRYGWCAIVRPDRIVLNDGPVSEADRLISEAIALISAPNTEREMFTRRSPDAA